MPHRIERINNLIRQEISELLQREIKDPRLSHFVAVTAVSTSADMKRAKVFVSCISSKEEREEMLDALAAASGFLRRALTKQLRLRRIPELSFHWDDSIERGDRLLRLMDQIDSQEH